MRGMLSDEEVISPSSPPAPLILALLSTLNTRFVYPHLATPVRFI